MAPRGQREKSPTGPTPTQGLTYHSDRALQLLLIGQTDAGRIGGRLGQRASGKIWGNINRERERERVHGVVTSTVPPEGQRQRDKER